MEQYMANYSIDHGVSPGFAVKSDDHTDTTEKITAKDNSDAFKLAYKKAEYFADDYLSDSSGFTTVEIISLIGPNGEVVDQPGTFRGFLQNLEKPMPENVIDGLIQSNFKKGKLVLKRSMLEHVLSVVKND